jgi:hypothetical protein
MAGWIEDTYTIALNILKAGLEIKDMTVDPQFNHITSWRVLKLLNFYPKFFTSPLHHKIIFQQNTGPLGMRILSIYCRPKLDVRLPFFITEIVKILNKRICIVDIYDIYKIGFPNLQVEMEELKKLHERFQGELGAQITVSAEIDKFGSPCRVKAKVGADKEPVITETVKAYMSQYVKMCRKVEPIIDVNLKREIQEKQKAYAKDAIVHDPGVKGLKTILGGKKGIEVANLLFFD